MPSVYSRKGAKSTVFGAVLPFGLENLLIGFLPNVPVEEAQAGETLIVKAGESVSVDEATNSKAPIAKMADKVSGVFVPVVISIALIAVIVWLLMGYGFEFALSIGISILVISCPCALGLATPTAIMVGTGKGATTM